MPNKAPQQKGGIKRPPPELAKIIALIELVSPTDRLPDNLPVQQPIHGNGEALERLVIVSLDLLPPGLRHYLREYLERQASVAREVASQLRAGKGLSDDLKRHLRESPIPRPDTPASLARAINLVNRYLEIREWRESLRRIARREHQIRTSVVAVTKERPNGALYLDYSSDRFGQALDGVDLRYIRECVICHRIYFAGRIFYQGKEIEPYDTPECGKKVRARRVEPKPQKPPAKTKQVKSGLKALCRDRNWKQFPRTSANIKELSEVSGATEKECNRVLDYLEQEGGRPTNKEKMKLSDPDPFRSGWSDYF